MQNLNKKASILLWSIFLSLMISTIFISVGIKINKSISENKKITEKIKNNSIIKNKIKDTKKNIIKLDENTNIIITGKNSFLIGLKKDEEIKVNITDNTNITLSISKNSLVSYNTGNTEKIISDNIIFFSNSGETLKIKNLGGFSKVKVYSEKDINLPFKKYKIIQKIGNKNIIKQEGEIK